MTVTMREVLKLNKAEKDFLETCENKLEEISEQCETGGELDLLINLLQSALTNLSNYVETT